ncbi:hypothetical protein P7H12_24890 [Paenibacillus larvae]|nr:hypothetical protein [Paenibacillus larvae]MDT2266178.1 hypothetical protein [Paenibacillus larvae]
MGTVWNLNIKVNLDAVNFQKTIEQINREMQGWLMLPLKTQAAHRKILEMRKIS